jgi:predicted DNA-binding protein (MmcQ/YjbR family)
MQAKPLKVFIGKDISRTASLVVFGSGCNIAEGEIAILDKNKNVMTSGQTFSDTDKIYVVEGLSDTYDYVTPAGSSITGIRKLIVSDVIDGNAVFTYAGASYAPAVEAVFTLSGSLTPVTGTEYTLRVVYKDMEERPGQFTYTYRVVATSTSLTTLYSAFVTAINKHAGRRIFASSTSGPDVLTITALAYNDNEYVDSINEYKQVNPAVFLYSNNWSSVVITQTVYPTQGIGTWRLVRDEEKWSQGYEGALNRIHFPIILPAFRTVKNETYDVIVINHKNWYTGANSAQQQVDITTKIFLPDSAGQTSSILAVLNGWMESLPKGLNNITL